MKDSNGSNVFEDRITESYFEVTKKRNIDPATITMIIQAVLSILQQCKNKKNLSQYCERRPLLSKIIIGRNLQSIDTKSEDTVNVIYNLGCSTTNSEVKDFLAQYGR